MEMTEIHEGLVEYSHTVEYYAAIKKGPSHTLCPIIQMKR